MVGERKAKGGARFYMAETVQGADHLDGLYAALRNLDSMERAEFREIIKSVLRPSLRERYLTFNYHRAAFNVEMMLAIKDTKQFQTLGSLARSIF
jgi:hypothetical protein